MEKMKGVLYVRVSTTKEEQDSSLEIQEQALYQICESKNIEIIDTYSDKSSGTRIRKRRGFLSMLYDAGIDFEVRNDKDTDDFIINKDRKPKMNYILVKDIFRFGRNSSEGMEVIKALRKNKVYVFFVNSSVDTFNDDFEFTTSMLFNIAQNESHNTSRRIKFSKRHLAKQGKYSPARLPFGYKRIINEQGEKEIVIDEEQAKIVRFIFERYKTDGGHVISQILNNKGIPTQQGNKWSDDKIHRIIKNSCYVGNPTVQRWTKDNVTDAHFHKADEDQHVQLFNVIPAIVTEEQFKELQAIRKQRTNSISKGKRIAKDDIFYEKLFCSKCGARFIRHVGDGKKVTYMCQTRRKFGAKECDCKGIAYNSLVKFIDMIDIKNEIPVAFNTVHKMLMEIFTAANTDLSKIEKEFDAKIATIDTEIISITRSFISANEAMREELNRMMDDLKVEKNKLLQQKQKANSKELSDLINQLDNRKEDIRNIYKNNANTFEGKLELIDKITVDSDKVSIGIKGLVFVEEMMKFNEIAEGTKYKIEIGKGWFKTDPVKRFVFNR